MAAHFSRIRKVVSHSVGGGPAMNSAQRRHISVATGSVGKICNNFR